MKEGLNTEELKEAARETYRQLQNKLERKMEEAEEVKIRMRGGGGYTGSARRD